MLFKKKLPLTGIARVEKVIASFKIQVNDLTLGISEINQVISRNTNKVKKAEQDLKALKQTIDNANKNLSLSKDTAETLKNNLTNLLGLNKENKPV